ncbi:hypothetical protein ACRAQ7_14010 [Erythrobacter sp. W53]|uniref:hypothetical protein n=1 Tax=Erythrobacter sp. W53 TaxID=3425947 RepID=UPI003D7672F4
MKRLALMGGVAALALGSSLVMAQGQPTDLLPPGFDDPEPEPTASPLPPSGDPAGNAPTTPAAPGAPAGGSGVTTVQPLPGFSGVPTVSADPSLDLSQLPSVEELEAMSEDDLDELLGLKPSYDISPAQRRSLEMVGVIDAAEGGLPEQSLARQPAALVRAALEGTQRPLVSRWGHILLRRALASRMAAPEGMTGVEFAALRADLLNRLGEHGVARALVQDIDTGNYDEALLGAAVASYIGTADLVGACPAVRLSESERDDSDWLLLEGICTSFGGEATRGARDLQRLISREQVEPIDGLLAQRFAGAAGAGRRAVNIEWEDVEEVTPMRFALANAVREDLPEGLLEDAPASYSIALASAQMMPLAQRAEAAQMAAARGVFSSSAMVDLYSQIYANGGGDSNAAITASRLRAAYVQGAPAQRVEAIRDVWEGDDATLYGRHVLTAFAAARLPASEELASDAAELIASMLTAGLDRDAMRWSGVVTEGSEAWGLLALARPNQGTAVTDGQLADFLDQDESDNQQKSKMLFAGLSALGRINQAEISEYSQELGVDLARGSRWTRAIDDAARADNPALVSLLAGLGMQGSSWDKMTALHLYHIVRALNEVGLDAEARMIAAEAVARA